MTSPTSAASVPDPVSQVSNARAPSELLGGCAVPGVLHGGRHCAAVGDQLEVYASIGRFCNITMNELSNGVAVLFANPDWSDDCFSIQFPGNTNRAHGGTAPCSDNYTSFSAERSTSWPTYWKSSLYGHLSIICNAADILLAEHYLNADHDQKHDSFRR